MEVYDRHDNVVMCQCCAQDGSQIPAIGHSKNPDWSGYWLCQDCIDEYDARAPLEPRPPVELTSTKRLQRDGSGLGIHVDRAITDALGVDYGDLVEVTIRRVE